MKKLVKLFICMLAFVAGIGMAVANPAAINVVSALTGKISDVSNQKGAYAFEVKNMPTTVDADADTEKKGFAIPVPSVGDYGYDAFYIHVSNGKTTHTQRVGQDGTSKFVKDSTKNVYYYQYTANATYTVYFTAEKKDGKTYASSKYNVVVKGAKHTLDTANALIPTVAGKDDKILIPTMNVLDSEGEVVDGANVSVTVIKNNTVIEAGDNSALKEEDDKLYLTTKEYGTYTIRYKNNNYNLSKEYSINVTEKFDSSKVTLSASTLTMKQVELGKVATFPKPNVTDTGNNVGDVPVNVVISIYKKGESEPVKVLDANEYEYTFTEEGNYTVKYELTNLYLNNQKTKTIQIADDVVVADTIAPEVNFAGEYSTTAEDWEENVTIKGDWAVPTKTGYNGVTLPALYASDYGTDYADMTFQRVLIASNGEEYDIDKKQSDVKDGETSYLYNASLASDYTKDVTKAVTFTFPRKDDESDDDYITRVKGSYTLVYRATEKVGANDTERTGTKSVTIQFLGVDAASYNDDTHLSISLPSIVKEMKSTDSKTVTVSSATDDADKAIETHYYYYYGQKSAFETEFNNYKGESTYATKYADFNFSKTLNELTVENKKLTIEFNDYASSSSLDNSTVTIVAIAINDQGQFVYDAKEISIKNATTDDVAPTISQISGSFNERYVLGQDTEITLPSVTFGDTEDKKLAVSVQYYVDTPDEMKPVNSYALSYGGNQATITGAKINPSKAGMYYVVYTATDDANNSLDYIVCFEVVKETSYSIKIEYSNSLSIYDSSDIIATIVDDEGNEVDGEVTLNWSGLVPTGEGSTYTFNYAGDYSFYATANVAGKDVRSAICTIKVSDVAFKWDNEDDIRVDGSHQLSPSTKEYELLTNQPADWSENYTNYFTKVGDNYTPVTGNTWAADSIYKKNELVYVELIVPTASQNGHTQVADVKVTDPSGDEVELLPMYDTEGNDTGNVKFIAAKNGKYTITYTVGSGDNKVTKTLTTVVGDNNPPVVKLANKSSLEKDVVYNGTDITLKLTYSINTEKSTDEENVYDVVITRTTGSGDNQKVSKTETTLTLYDIDRLGNKVKLTWAEAIKNENITLNDKTSSSTSEYVWTISSVGDYTLAIKAQDGNVIYSDVEKVTFKVVDESSATEKKDNKTGIILIVVSLVVLAGLICFFAFGGKTKGNAPKTSKPKKEENKDEEKTQE